MKSVIKFIRNITTRAACAAVLASTTAMAGPLKIAYSDWPGWTAWQVGIDKGWFKEAGVDVTFEWFEYVPSMEAFAAGQVDAVCMTNGDALVTGATGAPSKMIIINDFSNGNDMVVAKPGIESVKDLKGKKNRRRSRLCFSFAPAQGLGGQRAHRGRCDLGECADS